MEDQENEEAEAERLVAEFDALKVAASTAFSPRTPISTKELFAGRWGQMQTIGDTVAQVGLHAVIFGERGVGKTSLTYVIAPVLRVLDSQKQKVGPSLPRIVIRVNANGTDSFSSLWAKALDEIFWIEDYPTIGLKPVANQERKTLRQAFNLGNELSIDEIRRTLVHLTGSVFIFDEFDRLPKRHASAFTDLVKALSDGAAQTTIVLVGVAETVDGIMKDHASIGRALIQIPMPRMNEKELTEILTNAEKALNVSFDNDARAQIVKMSQGLPHFTHLIGLHSVRAAADRYTRQITAQDVKKAFGDAVAQSDQTVASAYSDATKSQQPGAKYPQVLLAAAISAYIDSDAYGYFQPSNLVAPMTKILGRPEEIAGFNQHLSQFMEAKRGAVLERAGGPRAYRFRFSHPLLPPYVLMRSIRDGIVTADLVHEMLGMA
jgi:Cdc6-like AAA superfamily ATPase